MNTTQTSSAQCQVLVVGAGPTGLVLAAQLLARGIQTRVIDKGHGPHPESRAISIHARTVELLDTMGLADTFVERGHRVRRFHMYAGHRTVLDLDLARNGSPYGFMLHLPQSETERLLRARVRELGGGIEPGTELVGVSDHGDVVVATVRDAAGRESELSAGYVVGCDGAHSRLRYELGLTFDGQPYPQDWLLADVTLEGVGRDDESHVFFRPQGLPLVCLPMGRGRWRAVLPNSGERGGQAPSFAEVQDLIARRAPHRIRASDPGWLACFRCQMRSTGTYRRGRLLLAGDAAHIHSPAGGQGMNTGMSDAYNLAWKLALVAQGRAPDGLLDTYGDERVPVASGVLGLTDRIVGWSTMRHPAKRALRNTVLPAATSLPAVQTRAARRLSQVSVAYPPSAIVLPDGHRRAPKPGQRVANVEVMTEAGSTRLYDALRRGRHVLLVGGPGVRTAVEKAGLDCYPGLVDVVRGQVDIRPRRGSSGAFALVRPDGVLAVRGSSRDAARVRHYLRAVVSAPDPDRLTPGPCTGRQGNPGCSHSGSCARDEGSVGDTAAAVPGRPTWSTRP
jgi:2-polyprenyl-6-methoxyphenol hydroxylase-like FAD-dependent oxidoreductase